MPGTLTKTTIDYVEMRVYRTLQPDSTWAWYVAVVYDVQTAEGEVIHRSKDLEITSAAQKTTLVNWFNIIRDRIRAEEGIA